MDGIHDMGGMHGFGPIRREKDEPVFHQPWEGRLLALRVGTAVQIPGGLRRNIEGMDPAHYLSSSYYEKWLHAWAKGLLEAGALTAEELEEREQFLRQNPQAPLPRRQDPERVRRVLEKLRAPEPRRRDLKIQPRFHPGDPVRTRHFHPPGHTRLPRYARGRRGVVMRFYGICDFEDDLPPGAAAGPQPLYAVRFAGRELWGESAEPNSAVCLDLWESYLEAV